MMFLPIAVFLIVTALVYGLALPLIRGGKNRADEVFSGSRRRPLIFGPITGALAGVIPCSAAARAKMSRDLRQAGYYHRFALEEFLSIRNVLVVGWVFLIGTLIAMAAEPGGRATVQLLAVGAGGVLLFYGLPFLVLRGRANARLQRIQNALPDALDMITMCMAGGLPLEHALGRVSKELVTTHPDLACELRIMGRQMKAGSLEGALRHFAARIDTPDVQSLTAMVGQTDRQGSSVALAFEDFGDSVRQGRRQRAEEHGNKTSIKLLLPLVFCLAPPVYMLLLTPAVIELRSFMLRENRPGGVLSPNTVDSPVGALTQPLLGPPRAGEVREDSPQR